MSVLVYLAISFGAGTLGLLTRRRPPVSIAIGLAGLAAAVVAAVAIVPGDRLQVGESALVASDFQRLFLVFGSVAGLALTVMALAAGWQRNLPSAMLAGLGALALGLGLPDPLSGLAATAAAGLPGILVAITTPVEARGVRAAARELRAVAVTGALTVVAAALVAGPAGLIGVSRTVLGLAYLAMAIAVAVRIGAIPFHTRVARVTGAAPGAALPLLLAWAPAGFASAALVWVDRNIQAPAIPLDAERLVIVVVGLLCLLLGVLAAAIQDDVEHVVGYSVIQDAGFVMLALTIFDIDGWEPARTWLLIYVLTKSAFAGWALALHGAFGTSRIIELSGWARRAPLLAIALVAIVLATVGLPGLLVFDVRNRIADLALGTQLGLLGIAGGLGSLLYYGRLARAGMGPVGPAVAAYAGNRFRGVAVASASPDATDHTTDSGDAGAGDADAATDDARGGAETPGPGGTVVPVAAAPAAAQPAPEPLPLGLGGEEERPRRSRPSRKEASALTRQWAREALMRTGLGPTTSRTDEEDVAPPPGSPAAAGEQSPGHAAQSDAAPPAGAAAGPDWPARPGSSRRSHPPGRVRGRRTVAAPAGRVATARLLWELNQSLVATGLAVVLAVLGLAAAAGAFGIADAARAPAPLPGGATEPIYTGPSGPGTPGESPGSSASPAASPARPPAASPAASVRSSVSPGPSASSPPAAVEPSGSAAPTLPATEAPSASAAPSKSP